MGLSLIACVYVVCCIGLVAYLVSRHRDIERRENIWVMRDNF